MRWETFNDNKGMPIAALLQDTPSMSVQGWFLEAFMSRSPKIIEDFAL